MKILKRSSLGSQREFFSASIRQQALFRSKMHFLHFRDLDCQPTAASASDRCDKRRFVIICHALKMCSFFSFSSFPRKTLLKHRQIISVRTINDNFTSFKTTVEDRRFFIPTFYEFSAILSGPYQHS